MNKTFKGLLADQEELKIRLSTNDGLSGYQITKFTIFPKNFNVGDEHNFKIFTVSGKTLSTVFDFNDPQLLAAAYIENAASIGDLQPTVVVIDNKIINQDIFIQHTAQSGNACNFYLELEQVKLDLNEATVATLKDMRGRE